VLIHLSTAEYEQLFVVERYEEMIPCVTTPFATGIQLATKTTFNNIKQGSKSDILTIVFNIRDECTIASKNFV
jgi:hypothetical protein